ncbi:MAG: hypothetical protein KJ571_05145 [Bacteroidetes bacterium]|nr:hypothetical protein [Bacteroidota bacterium]
MFNLRFNIYLAIGISLIITGILFLLKFFEITNTSYTEIVSYILIIYGFVTAYFSLGTGSRGRLFFASAAFLIGIMFYVINNNEILNPDSAVFPSMLFITGACFIILFIDNTKERVFLYSGMLLLIISYSSIVFFNNSIIIQTANKLSNIVLEFWPVFLLLFGINILLMRKR